MKKVYIAGKIKGLSLSEVDKKFSEAQLHLLSKGYLAFNPFEYIKSINEIRERAYTEILTDHNPAHRAIILRLLTEKLLQCDMIYMLPCWQDSQGAKYEKTVADMCGIENLEIF